MQTETFHAICAGTDLHDVDWGRCSGVYGIDGDCLLQPVESPHASWSGLPIVVQVLPGNAVATDFHLPHASLALARTGRGKRRYSSGRRSSDLYSSPSMFELYAGGYCIDRASWDGVAGEVISVQFPALQVNRLLHVEGRGFELPVKHELFDSRIADLTLMLWEEAQHGGPRGRLYGDGISLALLGLLVEEHGACTRPEVRSRARLAPAQIALIRDYIDEHLCTDLSVEHLAALMDYSLPRGPPCRASPHNNRVKSAIRESKSSCLMGSSKPRLCACSSRLT